MRVRRAARPTLTSLGLDPVAERLETLFRSESDAVFAFVYARCGRRDVAEDVTAEVFYEVARRHAEGRGDEIGAGWLIDVARKRLVDHWRRAERERRRRERLHHEPARSEVPIGDAGIAAVVAALDALPERQRAAMVLRYVEDRTVAETADSLVISVEACESLLARGRRSLLAALENQEVSE
ncbi:MAG: sigma-70 family RNA polymerase sigma factor [Actinomycetota bacterium]